VGDVGGGLNGVPAEGAAEHGTGAPRLRGAILAGGSGTRLGGAAKGLLTVGGRRLIDRVHAALAPLCDDIAVIGDHADAATWRTDLRVLRDGLPGGGSAAGVHAALRGLASPLLLVAWDLPLVSTALLRLLADAGARGGAAHDAVVFAGAAPGSLEPCCAWLTPPVADAIERGWARGERSLHAALQAVRCTVLPRRSLAALGGADLLLRNVNTPADLAAAEREALLLGEEPA
jgi:molybdenum cofactor guanylyltransferase